MHYIYQEGRTVFKYAVSNMSDVSAAIAEKNAKEKKERQERLRYEKTKAKMAAWAAKTNTQLAIRAGKEVDGG